MSRELLSSGPLTFTKRVERPRAQTEREIAEAIRVHIIQTIMVLRAYRELTGELA